MADDYLDKEIAKAKRNAQAKMARIKKQQRYDVANSTNNPIRGDDKSMTRREKRSYLIRLQKFNSRRTKFYIDATGRPLSNIAWERYKNAEARANASVRADLKKYAKLHGPEGDKGKTLGELVKEMRPKNGKLLVNPSGSNMHEVERKPTAIDSTKKLEKLTKSQLDKANPAKQAKRLKIARQQLEKMASGFGDSEMIRLASELTDEQFKVLWNYTHFASNVSLKYVTYMQSLVDEKSFHINAMENADRNAYEYLKWAKSI